MENKFRRLAIISDCVHMRNQSGNVVTENHIYCRQMQELAKHFDQTVIVCPFVKFEKETVTSIYHLPSIKFIELPNVGGTGINEKWKLIKTIPTWLKAFTKALKISDVVYLRMPNNLNIPGFFYFSLRNAKMFATYTGTWKNYKNEPPTYRFQKWLLSKFFKGPVWVYTDQVVNKKQLFKSISPSYSEMEWNEESLQVAQRISKYNTHKISRPVFITVGSLVPNKNQQYILDTCKALREKNFDFYWYIVGDGYMKETYTNFIKENKLADYVCLAGKKTYTELRELYRQANFIVQATLIEGFGKAPVEAMFHGVIPLLSITALSKEMTGNGTRGLVFDVSSKNALEKTIEQVLGLQNNYSELILNARTYVKEQTLENWARSIIYELNKIYKNA